MLDTKRHNPHQYHNINVYWNLEDIILVEVELTQKVGSTADDPEYVTQ